MNTKAPGGGHATVKLAGRWDELAPPAPHVHVALLVYHRDGAEFVPLPEGASVVVGRQLPSDVVVPDVSLSRQHARFTNAGGEITVEDLGSSNGTRRRGEPVERVVVLPGEELALGSVLVAVQAADTAARKGLIAYDRLCDQLEAEIVRAHFFGRTLSVLMVRGAREKSSAEPHFPAFHARVHAALRPVDRLGLYSSEALLAFLPELDAEAAMALARTLTSPTDARLLVGVATYPESGTSAGELVAACREADQAATPAAPAGRWQVQLGALNSEASARSAWESAVRKVPELASRHPVITELKRENQPTLWRLRVGGLADVAAARALCDAVKAKGGNCVAVSP